MPTRRIGGLALAPESRLLPWLLGGLVVYAAYGHWLAPLGPAWVVGSDLIYLPFRSTAAVVMYLAGRSSQRRRVGQGWTLLAAGEAFQVIGNITWVYADATGNDVSDGAYLAWTIPAGLLWVAGLWHMLRPAARRESDVGDWADAAILMVAATIFAWYFVAARYVQAEVQTPGALALFLSDQTLSIATCFFAVAVWLRGPPGVARAASSRLWLSWVLVALADVVFEWMTVDGTYVSGNLIDTAYAAGIIISTLAAEQQWRHPAGDPPDPTRDAHVRVARSDALVFGAVVLALIPLAVEVAHADLVERPLSAAGFGVVLLMLLVLWRQRVARRAVGRLIVSRLKLEQQLWEAQKHDAVGRLAAGIAHDFNNILAGISAHAQLVQSGASKAVADDAREIEFATQRAAVLVKRLLAFSRSSETVPRAVVLGDTVASMHAILRQLMVGDIELRLALEDGRAVLLLGDGQLEQVLLNLAINARDATGRGGVITVTTRRVVVEPRDAWHRRGVPAGPWAVLEVRDSGAGMDEATRERIFQPFFTTKGATGGTGLGLSTVLGIVEAADGRVFVESAPGAGTLMAVWLPATLTAAPPPQPPAPVDVSVPAPATILVVDDESPIRTAVSRFLERRGHRVLQAADGPDALAALDEADGDVDLLLTDVRMPEMSGTELAAQAKARVPRLAVLYMSGFTDPRLGADAPAADVLDKPFELTALAARIDAKLRARDAGRG